MDIEVAQRYKMRWTKENCPFPIPEPKERNIIHPVINSWDEFDERDKSVLSNIKNVIVENVGDCKVFIFGSRIKGYWTDESDYDIIVSKELSNDMLNKLRSINYGVMVDIQHYSDKFIPIKSYIEIY